MKIFTPLADAMPMASRVRTSALLPQATAMDASVVGTVVTAYLAVNHLPAFGKGVFVGVRAWSPPV